jgi:hypothetical protein
MSGIQFSLTEQIVSGVVAAVAGIAMCIVAWFIIRYARDKKRIKQELERAHAQEKKAQQVQVHAHEKTRHVQRHAQPDRRVVSTGTSSTTPTAAVSPAPAGRMRNQYEALPIRPATEDDNVIEFAQRNQQRRSVLQKSPSSRRRHLRERPAAPLPNDAKLVTETESSRDPVPTDPDGKSVQKRVSRRRAVEKPAAPLPDKVLADHGQYGDAPKVPADETIVRRVSKRHSRRSTQGSALYANVTPIDPGTIEERPNEERPKEKTLHRGQRSKRSRRHQKEEQQPENPEPEVDADADAGAAVDHAASRAKRVSAELSPLKSDSDEA